MSAPKRQALGRGLAALIPGAKPPEAAAPVGPGRGAEGLRTVAIEDVHPSPGQPRKQFDDARLDELAASIEAQGIIQPLVVRLREGGGYELIAGERRWRAAQRAGLHEVPAVVRDVAEKRAFEMALVENLQREDLNPIEEAQGFERLIDEFGYTQEALATRVGKDRSTVANALRLLRLPTSVRGLVTEGRLQMGHARALLGLESTDAIERLARRVVARELSVRQVEALVKRERDGKTEHAPEAPAKPSSSARALGERLSRALGTRVRVVEAGPGKGHLEVAYHSLDQLDAVLARILRP
jgi:ParB family transcriptional regulator, chromosome partitioning protein